MFKYYISSIYVKIIIKYGFKDKIIAKKLA